MKAEHSFYGRLVDLSGGLLPALLESWLQDPSLYASLCKSGPTMTLRKQKFVIAKYILSVEEEIHWNKSAMADIATDYHDNYDPPSCTERLPTTIGDKTAAIKSKKLYIQKLEDQINALRELDKKISSDILNYHMSLLPREFNQPRGKSKVLQDYDSYLRKMEATNK